MNEVESSPPRLVLVDRNGRTGRVLEHALDARGWDVTRIETGRGYVPWEDPDVVLLVLDDDDIDIFEMLMRLSSLPRRPPVVLLTRRADARVLDASVLDSLGVDRLVAWPCRIEQLIRALDQAQSAHEPVRLVS
jgi:DNA-binding response OmpR family regulator